MSRVCRVVLAAGDSPIELLIERFENGNGVSNLDSGSIKTLWREAAPAASSLSMSEAKKVDQISRFDLALEGCTRSNRTCVPDGSIINTTFALEAQTGGHRTMRAVEIVPRFRLATTLPSP